MASADKRVETMNPYMGLRPYEEKNKDIFFGRDQEREILIDKLLANKLTLLFAATGVGKSSLLQAAVLPELKETAKENLDVIYYSDWVSDPLKALKKETINVLKTRGKPAVDYQADRDIPLKKFFRLCAAFASEPLVVILDQFEEFFQYRKYKENYIRFIEEFSQCIKDREAPVVFLLSMREDFALELNAFKNYLPTTLFENYFRLEKLTKEKAKNAIRSPVELRGFHYEDELLDALLNDLAHREKEARLGTSPGQWVKDMPSYVEPPYLQIVCSQLWELERQNPDKKIRMEVYKKRKEAKGFMDYYFHDVMNKFSLPGKKIASKAFNHLVTPRGTKMAYPTKELANLIRVDENDLEKVLEKLRESRVLRSQKREGVLYYELYHDIFSKIIYDWNEKFKTKQRYKHASFISAAAILFILLLFIIYDIISNSNSHYLRLSSRAGVSDTVEVYRGKLGTLDILNLNRYQAETFYQRNQVEPDKLFGEKQVGDFAGLNDELMGHLPLLDRISAYWQGGETGKALKLAGHSISESDITRTDQVIALIPEFASVKSYELLKERLANCGNPYIERKIVDALALMPPSLIEGDFIALLEDNIPSIRWAAASTLGQIGSNKAVGPLIQVLKEQEPDVRRIAADALGRLGSGKAVEPLIELLKDQHKDVRRSAADTLGVLGSNEAVEPLSQLLKDRDTDVRRSAAYALGRLGSRKAVGQLIQLLKYPDKDVRRSAADILGMLGSSSAVEPLIQSLQDPDANVRSTTATALGRLGSSNAVEPLIQSLQDPDTDVSANAAYALSKIGSSKAVGPLIQLIKSKSSFVRFFATSALSRLGSSNAVEPLVRLIKEGKSEVRSRAISTLIGLDSSSKAVEPLIQLLKDREAKVRSSAAGNLGQLGSKKAVGPLIQLLKDQHPFVRSKAADALGKLRSKKAVEPLIQLLMDREADVRSSAAEALGLIGGKKAVGPLNQSLKDPDKYVRRSAAEALGRLGSINALEPLSQLSTDHDPEVRRRAADALGRLDSRKAVTPLLQFLKDRQSFVRSSAADALAGFGSSKAVEPLIQLLKDQHTFVRSRAAGALGQHGNSKAVEPLSQLLKDQPPVRGSAAEALGMLGSSKAVEPLLQFLKSQGSLELDKAAHALSKLGSGKAVTPLRRLLQGQDNYLRRVAADALSRLSSSEAVEPLLQFLKDRKPDVRIFAADALGRIGSSKAVVPLIQMLKDREEEVRSRAADALGRIGSSKAVEPLSQLLKDREPDVRQTAAISLGKLSAIEKQEDIINLYKNKEEKPAVRMAAAAILLKFGHNDGLEYLRENIRQSNAYERTFTAGMLDQVISRQGTSLLIEMLKDKNLSVKRQAILSLGNIRTPQCIAPLKKFVLNANERMNLRKNALSALAKIQHEDVVHVFIKLLNNNAEELLYNRALQAIGQMKSYDFINHRLKQQLKTRLSEHLNLLEENKAKWRKIRDENTENYSEDQMGNWRKRLKAVEPKEYLEFELSFALSRIDPEEQSIRLLSHHLANVRQGAWMGLEQSRNVTLIEKLYRMRKESDLPWVRHAAYRAIDHILIAAETFGSKKESGVLEALLQKLLEKEGKDFHPGVKTRIEWTIDRLKKPALLPENKTHNQ